MVKINTKDIPSDQEIRALAFRSGGNTYFVPVTNIVRVMPAVATTPIPGRSLDKLAGCINYGGHVIPVVNLIKREIHPDDLMIIIQIPGAGKLAALVVEGVDDIEDFQPLPENYDWLELILEPEEIN